HFIPVRRPQPASPSGSSAPAALLPRPRACLRPPALFRAATRASTRRSCPPAAAHPDGGQDGWGFDLVVMDQA
ncbi:unnamed protein product, partial [Urochloa humidicola]